MHSIDYEELKYNRQYILSDVSIECPFKHQTVDLIDNYKLYYHPNLVFTENQSKDLRLILLGDIYSSENPDESNADILENLVKLSFDDLLLRTAKLAGRFAIIVIQNSDLWIFHDTSACRKIYYTVKDSTASCSSSQHLLAKVLDIEPTTDPSKSAYYSSEDLVLNHYSNICDSTYYDVISQLIPNHFLNIKSAAIQRYWPHATLKELSAEECIVECADMIKGFMLAASKRYKLMLPVSAGYDSRILLAAAKEIKDEVFYYLNNSSAVRRSADSWVPQRLLESNRLKFNLLEISSDIDDQYREVYLSNNRFANPEMIDVMYNYLLHYPDLLNLPGGTIPIVKSMYFSSAKKITGEVLAKLHGYDKYDFAIKEYDEWLGSLGNICETTNTELFDLLYWEDRTPNWGTEVQLDKDIAQEEFNIFNSAYLVSRMLTYDINLRKQPHYKLHKELIRKLWPELLELPFNPSITNSIKQKLIKLGILGPVMKIKKFLFN